MSQAVPETVYIPGIDVLRMNIEVSGYLETVYIAQIMYIGEISRYPAVPETV